MIEAMKKVVLVSLDQDRQETLEKLRELEIFHAQYGSDESQELNEAVRACDELKSTLYGLQPFLDKDGDAGDLADFSAEQLAAKAISSLRELEQKKQEAEHLRQILDEIEPWGQFNPSHLKVLEQKGIYVLPCACPKNQIPSLPKGVVFQPLRETSKAIYFLVISDHPLDDVELPAVHIPETSPAHLKEMWDKTEQEIAGLQKELRKMASRMPDLQEAFLHRQDVAEFLKTRDSMGKEERLLHLSGYIPARREDDLRKAAHTEGWAFLLTDPEETDRKVPTLITVPKWLEISKPIFDFVGIQPGYREFDISVCFLTSMTIFFAMIFGDGGYGSLIFLGLLAGYAWSEKMRTVSVRLLLLFSFTTIIWGFLTGTFFGMDRESLPPLLSGLEWFTSEENNAGMKNTQRLCFLIGAVHLSIGHSWRALASIPSITCLSQVGWISILWGNFFLGSQLIAPDLYPFPTWGIWLYLMGVLLVLLFTNPSWRLHRSIGSGIGAILSSGVNSFVDVLSYIRLFAVGLSSFYVANSFNKLGTDLMGGDKGALAALFGTLVGVIIILFGHTLNLVLASLGVLVHGIRLNTLEFSGHIGIEWAGIAFRPFTRRSKRGAPQS